MLEAHPNRYVLLQVEAIVQLNSVAEQQANMGRQLAEAAAELDGAASTPQALTGRFRLAPGSTDKPAAKSWGDEPAP